MKLFKWIKQQTGLHITAVNKEPVMLALRICANEAGMNQDMFAAGVMRGEIDAQSFVDQITTHESFFLRHKRSMELAIERVVRPLIKKGIKPRILCAPCAQGEEPYAMAMLLQDRGINPSQVEITGVDIAKNVIKQAKSGLYMDYSVRNAPQSFINWHFKRMADGKLQVHPAVKKAVKFIRHYWKMQVMR